MTTSRVLVFLFCGTLTHFVCDCVHETTLVYNTKTEVREYDLESGEQRLIDTAFTNEEFVTVVAIPGDNVVFISIKGGTPLVNKVTYSANWPPLSQATSFTTVVFNVFISQLAFEPVSRRLFGVDLNNRRILVIPSPYSTTTPLPVTYGSMYTPTSLAATESFLFAAIHVNSRFIPSDMDVFSTGNGLYSSEADLSTNTMKYPVAIFAHCGDIYVLDKNEQFLERVTVGEGRVAQSSLKFTFQSFPDTPRDMIVYKGAVYYTTDGLVNGYIVKCPLTDGLDPLQCTNVTSVPMGVSGMDFAMRINCVETTTTTTSTTTSTSTTTTSTTTTTPATTTAADPTTTAKSETTTKQENTHTKWATTAGRNSDDDQSTSTSTPGFLATSAATTAAATSQPEEEDGIFEFLEENQALSIAVGCAVIVFVAVITIAIVITICVCKHECCQEDKVEEETYNNLYEEFDKLNDEYDEFDKNYVEGRKSEIAPGEYLETKSDCFTPVDGDYLNPGVDISDNRTSKHIAKETPTVGEGVCGIADAIVEPDKEHEADKSGQTEDGYLEVATTTGAEANTTPRPEGAEVSVKAVAEDPTEYLNGGATGEPNKADTQSPGEYLGTADDVQVKFKKGGKEEDERF